MDPIAPSPVGVFVIISFLLIGLVFMGCMLYWNWSHRKQRAAELSDTISTGNPCIYEKTNQRAYNRSSNGLYKYLLTQIACYCFWHQYYLYDLLPRLFLTNWWTTNPCHYAMLNWHNIFVFSFHFFCFSFFLYLWRAHFICFSSHLKLRW